MTFQLYYSGAAGNLSASLYRKESDSSVDHKIVASTTGLKNAKAARKWGAGEAELHKIDNTPLPVSGESVSISGHKTFTI